MTTLVVPCFNEVTRLPFREFLDFGRSWPGAFLFVDDGSTDDTSRRLDALVAELPLGSSVLPLGTNVGKAEAVRAGIRAAIDAGATTVGYWDADLATPLGEVGAFELLLDGDGCDVVIGARVALAGRSIERRRFRHYAGRAFATAASITLGFTIYDTQCGAKLFRVTPALQRALDTPFASRWIFDVEFLARIVAQHPDGASRIREVPLHAWHDVGGSKLRPTDYAQAAVGAARLYRTRR